MAKKRGEISVSIEQLRDIRLRYLNGEMVSVIARIHDMPEDVIQTICSGCDVRRGIVSK